MPNPLRRKVKYLLEPLKLLERPNLAAHVAVIASLWTKVEIELGKLIIFVSGNPKEGAATFNALKSAGSRGDVIRAIAQLRLDKDEIKQLEDLLKEYRRIAGERNDIIHNLWGISDDMPEALLRVNAEEIISNLAHVVASFYRGGTPPQAAFREKRPIPVVYKGKDFIETEKRITSLVSKIHQFHFDMGLRRSVPGMRLAPLRTKELQKP